MAHTFEDLAMDLEMAANNLEISCMKAEEIAGKEAKKIAIKESSGSYSLRELKDMDFPYARRHGKPLLPADIINIQTSVFVRAWKLNDTRKTASKIITVLSNRSKVADYLQPGTSLMFARPVDLKVAAIVAPTRDKLLHQAVTRSFRKFQ